MAILKTLGKLVAGTAAACAVAATFTTSMIFKRGDDMAKGQYKFKYIVPSETSIYYYSNTNNMFLDVNGAGTKDFRKYLSCRSLDKFGSTGGFLSGKVSVTKDNFSDALNIIKENSVNSFEVALNCEWKENPPIEVTVSPLSSVSFHAGMVKEKVFLRACEKSFIYEMGKEFFGSYIPDCFFKRLFPDLYFKYYIRTHDFEEIPDKEIDEFCTKAQNEYFNLLKRLGFNVYLDDEKV